MGQHPSDTTLQENIKPISPLTREVVNLVLVQHAACQDAEKGRTVRFDSIAVDANIHYPTDSTLLQGGYRAGAQTCFFPDYMGIVDPPGGCGARAGLYPQGIGGDCPPSPSVTEGCI
ncbi:hypothetical protein [Desulfobacca acetoxidans]|uniref:hypothetical protein n=1 Tax=Desulfobacca acetoxidans TaxID=60893 RepID=UPI0003030D4D|nr:hypothetical protein [Desulfobacca acetoxidans]